MCNGYWNLDNFQVLRRRLKTLKFNEPDFENLRKFSKIDEKAEYFKGPEKPPGYFF